MLEQARSCVSYRDVTEQAEYGLKYDLQVSRHKNDRKSGRIVENI